MWVALKKHVYGVYYFLLKSWNSRSSWNMLFRNLVVGVFTLVDVWVGLVGGDEDVVTFSLVSFLFAIPSLRASGTSRIDVASGGLSRGGGEKSYWMSSNGGWSRWCRLYWRIYFILETTVEGRRRGSIKLTIIDQVKVVWSSTVSRNASWITWYCGLMRAVFKLNTRDIERTCHGEVPR